MKLWCKQNCQKTIYADVGNHVHVCIMQSIFFIWSDLTTHLSGCFSQIVCFTTNKRYHWTDERVLIIYGFPFILDFLLLNLKAAICSFRLKWKGLLYFSLSVNWCKAKIRRRFERDDFSVSRDDFSASHETNARPCGAPKEVFTSRSKPDNDFSVSRDDFSVSHETNSLPVWCA
jgi:hypothetical protein